MISVRRCTTRCRLPGCTILALMSVIVNAGDSEDISVGINDAPRAQEGLQGAFLTKTASASASAPPRLLANAKTSNDYFISFWVFFGVTVCACCVFSFGGGFSDEPKDTGKNGVSVCCFCCFLAVTVVFLLLWACTPVDPPPTPAPPPPVEPLFEVRSVCSSTEYQKFEPYVHSFTIGRHEGIIIRGGNDDFARECKKQCEASSVCSKWSINYTLSNSLSTCFFSDEFATGQRARGHNGGTCKDYLIMAANTNACPEHSAPIGHVGTCQTVAESLGITFNEKEESELWPQGCYAHVQHGAYFNEGSGGQTAANGNAKLLCTANGLTYPTPSPLAASPTPSAPATITIPASTTPPPSSPTPETPTPTMSPDTPTPTMPLSSLQNSGVRYCGFAVEAWLAVDGAGWGQPDASCPGGDGCSTADCSTLADCKVRCEACSSCSSFHFMSSGYEGHRCWMKRFVAYPDRGYEPSKESIHWELQVNSRDPACDKHSRVPPMLTAITKPIAPEEGSVAIMTLWVIALVFTMLNSCRLVLFVQGFHKQDFPCLPLGSAACACGSAVLCAGITAIFFIIWLAQSVPYWEHEYTPAPTPAPVPESNLEDPHEESLKSTWIAFLVMTPFFCCFTLVAKGAPKDLTCFGLFGLLFSFSSVIVFVCTFIAWLAHEPELTEANHDFTQSELKERGLLIAWVCMASFIASSCFCVCCAVIYSGNTRPLDRFLDKYGGIGLFVFNAILLVITVILFGIWANLEDVESVALEKIPAPLPAKEDASNLANYSKHHSFVAYEDVESPLSAATATTSVFTFATCPSEMAMTSCNCYSSDGLCLGAIQENGKCVAKSGGVQAVARCVAIPGSTGWSLVTSMPSGNSEEAATTASCPVGAILTGCSCYSATRSCLGSKFFGNDCIAYSSGGGSVLAEGICGEIPDSSGWHEILSIVSSDLPNAPTSATCPDGTVLVGCTCYSPWGSCSGAKTSGKYCTAYNKARGFGVYAQVRCGVTQASSKAVYSFVHTPTNTRRIHFRPAWQDEREENLQFYAFPNQQPGTKGVYSFYNPIYNHFTFHMLPAWAGEVQAEFQFFTYPTQRSMSQACRDEPPNWKSTLNSTCHTYDTEQWCTSSGKFGPGWNFSAYGTFDDWTSSGITAGQACCVCGGGLSTITAVYRWWHTEDQSWSFHPEPSLPGEERMRLEYYAHSDQAVITSTSAMAEGPSQPGCNCSGHAGAAGNTGGPGCSSVYKDQRWCYTLPGACIDSARSAEPGQEWSFLACRVISPCAANLADGSIVREKNVGDQSLYVLYGSLKYLITSCEQCGRSWCDESGIAVDDPCVATSYTIGGVYEKCNCTACEPQSVPSSSPSALQEKRCVAHSAGCGAIQYQALCLASQDGSPNDVADGFKVAGEPCVWCGNAFDSCGIGNGNVCEARDWLSGMGHMKDSFTMATCVTTPANPPPLPPKGAISKLAAWVILIAASIFFMSGVVAYGVVFRGGSPAEVCGFAIAPPVACAVGWLIPFLLWVGQMMTYWKQIGIADSYLTYNLIGLAILVIVYCCVSIHFCEVTSHNRRCVELKDDVFQNNWRLAQSVTWGAWVFLGVGAVVFIGFFIAMILNISDTTEIVATPTPAPTHPDFGAKWGPAAWACFGLSQVSVFFLVCFIAFCRLRVRKQMGWQISEARKGMANMGFLTIAVVLFAGCAGLTYGYNSAQGYFWWLPLAPPLFVAVMLTAIIWKYFPDLAFRLADYEVEDEESEYAEGKTPPEPSIIPDRWSNFGLDRATNFDQMVYVDQKHHSVFDELLQQTYVAVATGDRKCPLATPCDRTPGGCPHVRPGGEPGLPTGYICRRVIRVEDSEMWREYYEARDRIREKRAGDVGRALDPEVFSANVTDRHKDVFGTRDPTINEYFLWHGTGMRAALSIAQTDFRIDLAGSKTGAMFGAGSYFGESITKADEYISHEEGHYSGVYSAILCRVILGKYHYTRQPCPDIHEEFKLGNIDSCLGDRMKAADTFREYVIFDNCHVYPEFIVLFSRIMSADDEQELRHKYSIPFQLELPVYWANCHKDPKTDAFDEHFKVRSKTKALIQNLIDKNYGVNSIDVLEVHRFEDSEMWNEYMKFKVKVRETLGPEQLSCASVEAVTAEATRLEKLLKQMHSESAIALDNLDGSLNEHLFWHGTSKEAAESIAANGFRIPSAAGAKHGARFGNGAYLAEDLAKSLHYTTSTVDGIEYVLLCRAVCGHIYHTSEDVLKDADDIARKNEKHSVLATPPDGQSREFIMLVKEQVYPEFVCMLKRR